MAGRPLESKVDLDLTIRSVAVVRRPLDFALGGACSNLNVAYHEAVLVTASDGQHYVIEKDLKPLSDASVEASLRDCNARVARVSRAVAAAMEVTRRADSVDTSVTLRDLLNACGGDYNVVANNCWNGAERMFAKASGTHRLPWQVNVAAGVATAALVAGVDAWQGRRRDGRVARMALLRGRQAADRCRNCRDHRAVAVEVEGEADVVVLEKVAGRSSVRMTRESQAGLSRDWLVMEKLEASDDSRVTLNCLVEACESDADDNSDDDDDDDDEASCHGAAQRAKRRLLEGSGPAEKTGGGGALGKAAALGLLAHRLLSQIEWKK